MQNVEYERALLVPLIASDHAAASERRKGQDWPLALRELSRCYLNKIKYGLLPSLTYRIVATSHCKRRQLEFKEIRVAQRHHVGHLPYLVTQDSLGFRCGLQFPWMHLETFANDADNKTRSKIVRRLLARLPTGVSLNFVFSPNLSGSKIVEHAFRCAGFKLVNVETFFYFPPSKATDLIATLTGKSIKTNLRHAKRDLELAEMPVADFISFHEKNIEAAGKLSYRDFETDRVFLEEGISTHHACILAARRKATVENPGPFPMDAAIACTWDLDNGMYKLWRITYRLGGTADGLDKPHIHATKFLILAAMEDAAAKGLVIDTDGSTPGLSKLYATFGPGVFERKIRLQCMRSTLRMLFAKDYPGISRKIGRMFSSSQQLYRKRLSVYEEKPSIIA